MAFVYYSLFIRFVLFVMFICVLCYVIKMYIKDFKRDRGIKPDREEVNITNMEIEN